MVEMPTSGDLSAAPDSGPGSGQRETVAEFRVGVLDCVPRSGFRLGCGRSRRLEAQTSR